MTSPVNYSAGSTVALNWASTTNADNSVTWQGTSPVDSFSYTIFSSMTGSSNVVQQLGANFATLGAAQTACQNAYDSVRRQAAWQSFFATHEIQSS